MPHCQLCYRKWGWKQTIKQSFTLGSGMTCPYCEAKQYIARHARKKNAIIPPVITALIMLGNLLFGPSYLFLFALIAFLLFFTGIYPFLIELSNKEEPLW